VNLEEDFIPVEQVEDQWDTIRCIYREEAPMLQRDEE
jgi:hypothetical protein